MAHLFCFGYGMSAQALARILKAEGWRISGTSRDADKIAAMAATGVTGHLWHAGAPLDPAILGDVTHILVSIKPDDAGDPVVRALESIGDRLPRFRWIGYLSTTGVYGDRGGDIVTEDTPPAPTSDRGRRRLAAEDAWRRLAAARDLPLHIFRLPGIYGPGRNPLEKILSGTARQVVQPGQVFCRIHVDDLAQALRASIDRPDPGRIYNICDDEPAPPDEVLRHAAMLLGLPPPPEVAPDDPEVSPMRRSFYAENKRVSNARMKAELKVALVYPTYREGLAAILEGLSP